MYRTLPSPSKKEKGKSKRRKPCVCNRMYAPVCGTDGRTKSNACMAICRGVEIACPQECPCGGGDGRNQAEEEVAEQAAGQLFR